MKLLTLAFRDAFELAITSLKNRFLRTALTMVGIFIGIAAVIALISLGQGMREAITGQFASLGTDKITIQASTGGFGPPGTGVVNKLTLDDVDAVSATRGVKLATRRLIRPLIYKSNDQTIFQFGASVPRGSEEATLINEAVDYVAESGRLLKNGDANKVAVGNNYATDSLFERPIRTGDHILANGQEMEVVGVLEKRGNFIVDNTILFPEDTLRDIVNDQDNVDAILVQTEPGFTIEQVSENLERTLRNERNEDEGEETFEISTPQDILGTVDQILFAIQAVVVGIAAISLFVGGVGITNTMYTSVLERTRDIGIMKAVGARNASILQLFLIEAGILGAVGGAIGITLGVALSKLVELAARLALGTAVITATINPYLLTGTLLFSFAVGAASGAIPAYRASRLRPVDVLRYE